MPFVLHYNTQNNHRFHKQSNNLTLTSRAFHNNVLGEYCEYVCNFFNYKRLLPMNTGVEACESACKIARKWAYNIKGVPENKAIMVFAANNFWGRSFAAVSASTDPSAFTGYGPFMPGFEIVEYNNISQLESLFAEKHSQIAAFMCEPIQGEAGVIIPDDDYLTAVRALCTKYNILWIADEVQTGLGRCGLRLCIDWHFMKNNGPDIIALGKALSGGLMPISCVLTKTDEIMDVLTPGTHGSTYGGNPLACKVAMTALQVLDDENMCENSQAMGGILLEGLREIEVEFDMVSNTRGKGLFCAMEIETNEKMNANAWDICLGLKNNGLLAKPTHEHIIRLSPPLIINKLQIEESLEIIRTTLKLF